MQRLHKPFNLLQTLSPHLHPETMAAVRIIEERIAVIKFDRKPGWEARLSQSHALRAKLWRVIGYLVCTDHIHRDTQATRRVMESA